MITDPAWMTDALCTQIGPGTDPWFPERGGANKAAKKICGRCPVRLACLEYAVTERIIGGIWGGLSEAQRQPLRGADL